MRSFNKPVKSTEAMAAAAAMPDESEGRVEGLCAALRIRTVGGGELWWNQVVCPRREGKVGVKASTRAGKSSNNSRKHHSKLVLLIFRSGMFEVGSPSHHSYPTQNLQYYPNPGAQPTNQASAVSRSISLKKKSIYVLLGHVSLWSHSRQWKFSFFWSQGLAILFNFPLGKVSR